MKASNNMIWCFIYSEYKWTKEQEYRILEKIDDKFEETINLYLKQFPKLTRNDPEVQILAEKSIEILVDELRRNREEQEQFLLDMNNVSQGIVEYEF